MEAVDLTLTNEKLNLLIYGAPGMGKTRFMGTVAKHYYTIFIDCDNGTKTLKQLPKEVLQNMVIIKMTAFTDLDKLYKLIAKNDVATWNSFFQSINLPVKVAKPFEAVAFDSFTQLQLIAIDELKKGNTLDIMGNLGKAEQLQIQHWGVIGDFMRKVVEAFTALPITFIGAVHEKMDKDELSGGIYGLPNLKGQFAFDISKYFDIMGRATKSQDGKFCLITAPQQRWQAKTRIPLPPAIVDPTYTHIFDVNSKY